MLMIEIGTRGGMCHAIHRYVKAKNKCMNTYDPITELSYLMYQQFYVTKATIVLNVKNKFTLNEEFIQDYDKESDKGYIFEVDVEYPKELHKLHSDLAFWTKRMTVDKCDKLCICITRKPVIHINTLT